MLVRISACWYAQVRAGTHKCVLVRASAFWYAQVRAGTHGSDSGEYRRGGGKREVSRVFLLVCGYVPFEDPLEGYCYERVNS